MKVYNLFAWLFSLLLFTGCGGGDTTISPDTGLGTYVDSAVDGVYYECGSKKGTTGDNGIAGGFTYELGKPCTFSINGIELSKIDGDKLNLKSVKVQVGDFEVARFLQSLDMDGDPDKDGIKIDAKVVEVLANNNETQLPSTPADVERIVSLLSSSGIGYMGEAKTKEQTEKHMAGFSVNISATKVKLFEGEELGLSADISGSSEGLTYNWAGLDETSQSFKISNLAAGTHTIIVYVTKGDITLSDSIVIEVAPTNEFIVAINSNKTKFNTADNVVLEANATTANGANLLYTYAWKDNDTDLGIDTKVLTKKFTAGSHKVSVDVTSGDVTKSASFDFNVSDLSNFNITSTTITQNSKGLMWVNDSSAFMIVRRNEKNASLGYDDSFNAAKLFCKALTFSNFTNWRTPNIEELSEYIKDTKEASIVTKYAIGDNMTQLLALSNGVVDESDGNNYRAVTTEYMSTNYFPVVGTVRDNPYISTTPNASKYPVGLRCVRNTDGSGGEDISGANISVSITGAKANYTVDEDVNLTANVTGATTTIAYSWKEDDSEIGTSSTLSKSDFSVGSHTINLVVTVDNINKSKNITFSVAQAPDLTDFNLTTLTTNNDEVIIQESTHLMWVNEHVVSKGKCAKIHGNDANHTTRYETEFASAKTFCSTKLGNFAGFSGWRTPTVAELKTFIISTINANILPAYDAPCKKLLALTSMGADTDSNSSYATVTTRYSSTPAQEDSNLIPSIGLRCVRDN